LNLFPKNKKCIFYFPKIPNKPALTLTHIWACKKALTASHAPGGVAGAASRAVVRRVPQSGVHTVA
jgi:hypothetical protein